MTKAKISEIKERLRLTSPGPWIVEHDIRPDVVCDTRTIWTRERAGYCGSGQIVKAASKSPGHVCELAKYWDGRWKNYDDADFIAHAREDIPALLEEIERLKKIRRKARKA